MNEAAGIARRSRDSALNRLLKKSAEKALVFALAG
jgi:hypothetical protein